MLFRSVLARQVADVAETRQDAVVAAEIFFDGLGLGRRLDDDEVHAVPFGLEARRSGKAGRADSAARHLGEQAHPVNAAAAGCKTHNPSAHLNQSSATYQLINHGLLILENINLNANQCNVERMTHVRAGATLIE